VSEASTAQLLALRQCFPSRLSEVAWRTWRGSVIPAAGVSDLLGRLDGESVAACLVFLDGRSPGVGLRLGLEDDGRLSGRRPASSDRRCPAALRRCFRCSVNLPARGQRRLEQPFEEST